MRHFGYIDVLLTHHRQIISEELIRRMNGFVADGSVRAWGMSAPSPMDAIGSGVSIIEANLSMMDTPRHRLWPVGGSGAFIARTPLNFGFH